MGMSTDTTLGSVEAIGGDSVSTEQSAPANMVARTRKARRWAEEGLPAHVYNTPVVLGTGKKVEDIEFSRVLTIERLSGLSFSEWMHTTNTSYEAWCHISVADVVAMAQAQEGDLVFSRDGYVGTVCCPASAD